MTIISNKSILTLSITAILVAGAFMFSPILVDAVSKQTCPTGQVMTGIDAKGKIICSPGPASSVPLKYTVLGMSSVAQIGGVAFGTATCDTGDIVTGGGFDAGGFDIFQSEPVLPDSANQWFAIGVNVANQPLDFEISAVCLDTALPAHIP